MKVKNIGDKPQTLTGSDQKLFVDKAEYAADTTAAIYLPESKALFEPINPGNEITGTFLFDLPKGAAPTMLELHDSAFSNGVKVKVA